MFSNLRLFVSALAISVFGALLCYFVFGLYFSEYEGLNIALLSGSLTPGVVFRSVYFSGNLVISNFYALFYEYFPGIEWISWFEYGWLALAFSLSLLSLNNISGGKISPAAKIFSALIIFLLVFAGHNIHLNYTRVSYLVCGVSLLALAVFFGVAPSVKNYPVRFVIINMFFLTGMLIRNEAALACLFMLLPFSVFYLKSFKRAFLILFFPVAATAGQTMFFAQDIKRATEKEFYKQVEPDIEEQFIARGNLKDIAAMKTHRDSVLYQMAEELTFSDPKNISAEFLRSLIRSENFLFTDTRQWLRVYAEQKEMLVRYWYLVLLALFLSTVLFFQIQKKATKKDLFLFFVFAASFWVLALAQTYVDKLNERSWLPYMGLFLLCHFALLVKIYNGQFLKHAAPAFVFASVLLAIHVFQLKKESNRLRAEQQQYSKQFEELKSIAGGKVVAINSSEFNFLFLGNIPFRPYNYSAFKKLYITDGYILPFLPYYRLFLEKECGCDIYAYPSFWNYLKNRTDDNVVVSSPKRIKVVQQYLKEIHQFDLPLAELYAPADTGVRWRAWTIKR